jgi:glycosyltransferase involved in cell wall biosynthesis
LIYKKLRIDNMRIGFIFSAWSTGHRPINFNELFSSQRGLTGSDLGICVVAKEFVKLGHDAHLFIAHENKETKPKTWEGVKLHNIEDLNADTTCNFDVLISWSDPNVFFSTSTRPLKLVFQMLNDFTYCNPNFDQLVDHWIVVCEMLKDHLLTMYNAPPPEKWSIVPLGCDPSWYKEVPRIPGRVVWTSSADRGLHLLLQEWPKIKAAVPEAHLKVFYNFNYGSIMSVEPSDINRHPHITEMAQRARYMIDAMKKLKPLDVEHVGSISRDRMAQELSEAMVLAYPCSTIAFSEGFSVSILESCAAGVFPVISGTDCLGSIYKDIIPVVDAPVEHYMQEFSDLVIKGLTDEPYRQEVITKAKSFAAKHTWHETAKKLEEVIKNHPKYKGQK